MFKEDANMNTSQIILACCITVGVLAAVLLALGGR
jgi:hypothetical protein